MPTCANEDCRREHEVSMEEIANLRSNYKDLQANCSRVVEENKRLRAALQSIHEHALIGQDDAAEGFLKIAGIVRDALEHPAPKSDI